MIVEEARPTQAVRDDASEPEVLSGAKETAAPPRSLGKATAIGYMTAYEDQLNKKEYAV